LADAPVQAAVDDILVIDLERFNRKGGLVTAKQIREHGLQMLPTVASWHQKVTGLGME
jgi:hypothetical protein